MSKIEYLQEQAARAERLARGALDKLTTKGLLSLTVECRAHAKRLAEGRVEAANFKDAVRG